MLSHEEICKKCLMNQLEKSKYDYLTGVARYYEHLTEIQYKSMETGNNSWGNCVYRSSNACKYELEHLVVNNEKH